VLRTLSPGWRVIAVDQTGMGYSSRSRPRRLAERVDELVSFCRNQANGPLVLVAHDWGGPVAVGAAASLDVKALVLANTAVAKPDDVRVPPLIALARRLTDLVCRRTPLFVDGAATMTHKAHREALRAPYRDASRRAAIADFVADIPVYETDPSWGALSRAASTLSSLHCPMLILWGGRDPVFHDRFLRDLRRRAPHADVERFAKAGHYVCLDEPVGTVIGEWLDRRLSETADRASLLAEATLGESPLPLHSVLSDLEKRGDDESIVYEGPDGSMTWKELAARSSDAAAALQRHGLRHGERVSLLIAPRIELLVAVFATWKAGGVIVVADASAGIVQLRRLIRNAAPSHVIGTPTTLALARVARFAPGARLAAFAQMPGATDLRRAPANPQPLPAPPLGDDVAAIVHTSGATGPAKPVRYTHAALGAQRDALAHLLNVQPDEKFTTSFGPFMLLAPVIGMGFVRPDFDVDEPGELGFDELAAALAKGRVSTAWLSPAAAQRIMATSAGRILDMRLVMLAGAPIPTSLVRAIKEITTAEVRAPYGMTECLPVTDGTDPLRRGALGGTATGRALPDCRVVVVALDDVAGPPLRDGEWGEILVSAPWMFDGYDARWTADVSSSVQREGQRFHRTGDVGYLSGGVLFQLGRAQHVIHTKEGALASVAVEEPVAATLGRPVAAVGVGPAGSSVVALVIDGEGHLRLASDRLSKTARTAATCHVAAVLEGRLPTDRRHQSKVDRTRLATQVAALLAGR
jgi:acyl-CoA synthetase (AMP-forming)/AMP-acid ligase II